MEAADLDNLKDYCKKLQRIIINEADFTFVDVKFVKKSKVDDLLCCIYGILPVVYKKFIKTRDGKKLTTAIQLSVIDKLAKRKFVFNPKYYAISYDSVNRALANFAQHIEKDIKQAEKNG